MVLSEITKGDLFLDYRQSLAVIAAGKESPTIEAQLAHLTIKSDDDEALVIETGVILARMEKELEAERKYVVDPLNKLVKEANLFFKPYSDKLSALKETARGMVSAWRQEKEEKRLAEQKRLDAILAEQRRKELEEAANNKTAAPAIGLSVPVAPLANTTHSGTGSATGRKFWTWSTVDLSKVPDEYFILDEKKINSLIKGGVREIPGLKIYQDSDISFRTQQSNHKETL